MDVKQLLIDTLLSTGIVDSEDLIFLQGSMSDDDSYPDKFFTFFVNQTFDNAFYDNSETQTIWDLDLNFYSNDPAEVNTVFRTIKSTLKSAGFIVDGLGYDVASDEPTHTGRGINLIYIEHIEGE